MDTASAALSKLRRARPPSPSPLQHLEPREPRIGAVWGTWAETAFVEDELRALLKQAGTAASRQRLQQKAAAQRDFNAGRSPPKSAKSAQARASLLRRSFGKGPEQAFAKAHEQQLAEAAARRARLFGTDVFSEGRFPSVPSAGPMASHAGPASQAIPRPPEVALPPSMSCGVLGALSAPMVGYGPNTCGTSISLPSLHVRASGNPAPAPPYLPPQPQTCSCASAASFSALSAAPAVASCSSPATRRVGFAPAAAAQCSEVAGVRLGSGSPPPVRHAGSSRAAAGGGGDGRRHATPAAVSARRGEHALSRQHTGRLEVIDGVLSSQTLKSKARDSLLLSDTLHSGGSLQRRDVAKASSSSSSHPTSSHQPAGLLSPRRTDTSASASAPHGAASRTTRPPAVPGSTSVAASRGEPQAPPAGSVATAHNSALNAVHQEAVASLRDRRPRGRPRRRGALVSDPGGGSAAAPPPRERDGAAAPHVTLPSPSASKAAESPSPMRARQGRRSGVFTSNFSFQRVPIWQVAQPSAPPAEVRATQLHTLDADALVWTDGLNDWLPLGPLPPFAELPPAPLATMSPGADSTDADGTRGGTGSLQIIASQ